MSLPNKFHYQLPRYILNNVYNPLRYMHIKRGELYQKCFDILGVPRNSDQNTVRKAYLELVKNVHPDSGKDEASSERFHEVDNAFKILQEKFAKTRRNIQEDEEEVVHDIRHTAPQHRQYLNFEGMGIGNPFQREKQYQQIKAMKAQDRVLNHRLSKIHTDEKSVVGGSFYKKHAIKTKYGFDRVVEDLIQEAMSKGDFNNLSGAGQPLPSTQSQTPYLDFTTHKLNKILLDNGFTPEWIQLSRDIRVDVDNLKMAIREKRALFGEYPLDSNEECKWKESLKCFETDVKNINKKIDKYNLIVPILDNQYFRINLENIADKILRNHDGANTKTNNGKKEQQSADFSDTNEPSFLSLLSKLF